MRTFRGYWQETSTRGTTRSETFLANNAEEVRNHILTEVKGVIIESIRVSELSESSPDYYNSDDEKSDYYDEEF